VKKILLALTVALLFILPGCGGGGSTNPNSCNFGNTTPGGRYAVTYPDGYLLFGTTNAVGNLLVPNRGYACSQLVVRTGPNFGFALTASPASVYLPSPPATGTITGQAFDATYGMPEVDYFDGNGYLVGAVYATSVSSDGTSLQANTPNLSNVYSGNYQIKVTNKTYDGYYLNIVGSAPMTAWGRDRPDSDGDGWYDDQDCDPYDPSRNTNCTETCGGYGTTPRYICDEMYY
jgi:hypothetical protein